MQIETRSKDSVWKHGDKRRRGPRKKKQGTTRREENQGRASSR